MEDQIKGIHHLASGAKIVKRFRHLSDGFARNGVRLWLNPLSSMKTIVRCSLWALLNLRILNSSELVVEGHAMKDDPAAPF
jgi:hypothetical protein